MNFLDKINLQPKSLLLIFVVVAILVISSALLELYQSKNEMYDLMVEQSHSLLESTLASSSNALLSYETLESELKKRLLNNANLVKLLYESKKITNELLAKIADENNIYRINIFRSDGTQQFRSNKQTHTALVEKSSPQQFLQPIFNDMQDTLIFGLKAARFKDEYRFTVAISSKNRSAIVLNIDAEQLLMFRNTIGFGSLLNNLTRSTKLIYAALQDSTHILAASGNTSLLDYNDESLFLQTALADSAFAWRTIETDTLEIFEAVHPFTYKDRVVGLFRLGISLEPLNVINTRIVRRIVIIGIILFILGSLLLTYIFTRQNFDLLKKRFVMLEGYSNKVIQNVSDAVIVIDAEYNIKITNEATSTMFQINELAMLGNNLTTIFNSDDCQNILGSNSGLEHMTCMINKTKKHLLVSKSNFLDSNESINTILVIRDLTNQKLMEEQIERKERLVAMGELASGIAHEIRNPLNTISTITQQLNKDFTPESNKDEYYTLSNIVAKEVRRINETIKSFLQFTKPEQITLNNFSLTNLLNQIEKQYSSMLDQKSTSLIVKSNWSGNVNWDRNQMQQAIMNLIQNAFDSIQSNGNILIQVDKYDDKNITLTISDNGSGIPKHLLSKIFNLYYTTKAKGTGIGLSMVQRIIVEHGGTVSVESEEGNGTIFSINIPINITL